MEHQCLLAGAIASRKEIDMSVLHNIYFSGKGTTKICAECIGAGLHLEEKSYDWRKQPCETRLEIPREDVLLFSMPVYGGFIPRMCAEMAVNLKGSQTPAIIAAVYGNRHYDDALLQMKDLLTAQGFWVIAAGAFLAEHSIFPAAAAGRPDEKDRAAMAAFSAECSRMLSDLDQAQYGEIQVPGKAGYDAQSFKGVPFQPDGDKACNGCMACVDACPKKAIDSKHPCETDKELCISCGACISVCPTGARNYHGDAYQAAGAQFVERCSAYRSPEVYFADKIGVSEVCR